MSTGCRSHVIASTKLFLYLTLAVFETDICRTSALQLQLLFVLPLFRSVRYVLFLCSNVSVRYGSCLEMTFYQCFIHFFVYFLQFSLQVKLLDNRPGLDGHRSKFSRSTTQYFDHSW